VPPVIQLDRRLAAAALNDGRRVHGERPIGPLTDLPPLLLDIPSVSPLPSVGVFVAHSVNRTRSVVTNRTGGGHGRCAF
jgi:hypothetical protein